MALMLRDASQRTWAVEAPALASGCDAPQHEGDGARRILAKRSQRVLLRSFPRKRGPMIMGPGSRCARPGRRRSLGFREQPKLAAVGNSRRRRPIVSGLLFRSEEHTSELQSLRHLVCRLLLEKK